MNENKLIEMGPFFLKVNDDFNTTAKMIFGALDIYDFLEGSSANSLDGIYYEACILGTAIKLEKNSYQYEEDFNYTLFIKKSYNSSIKVTKEIEKSVRDVVLQVLQNNLNADIAVEMDEKLL